MEAGVSMVCWRASVVWGLKELCRNQGREIFRLGLLVLVLFFLSLMIRSEGKGR